MKNLNLLDSRSETPGKTNHELLHRKKRAIALLKGHVVDEEAPKDSSKLSFSGVLEGIELPFDPQTLPLHESDYTDSEAFDSDYYEFGMDSDAFFGADYSNGSDYWDSEDDGCIIC